METLPQNPVTKLDEVNTIIHIYAVREEIKKATDEKYKQDCQKALNELEIHYRELSRKKLVASIILLNSSLNLFTRT